jgi:hypothetical protein
MGLCGVGGALAYVNPLGAFDVLELLMLASVEPDSLTTDAAIDVDVADGYGFHGCAAFGTIHGVNSFKAHISREAPVRGLRIREKRITICYNFGDAASDPLSMGKV